MWPIRGESSSNAFSWRLTGSQCTIDPMPTTNTFNSIEAIHREVHHRSAVRQTTRGVLLHRHGHRTDVHLQLRIRTPDPWLLVVDHKNRRQGAANVRLRATGGVDRYEVAAVEAIVPEGVTVIVNGSVTVERWWCLCRRCKYRRRCQELSMYCWSNQSEHVGMHTATGQVHLGNGNGFSWRSRGYDQAD